MAGQRVKVNCSVEYISFSAHTDFKQTTQFVRSLKPAHIILVHGEQTEMQKLKDALIRQYEDNPDYNIQVYNPRNTQPVELYFRGEKNAKVIGKLASNELPHLDAPISGILVKRNFKYHLMQPDDLPNYTDLAISTIQQRQSIPCGSEPEMVIAAVERVFGAVIKLSGATNRYRVMDAVDMVMESKFVVLEWESSPIHDMYADGILAEVLKTDLEMQQQQSDSNKAATRVGRPRDEPLGFKDGLLAALGDMFKGCPIECNEETNEIKIVMDGKEIRIDHRLGRVKCDEDKQVEQIIANVMQQVKNLCV